MLMKETIKPNLMQTLEVGINIRNIDKRLICQDNSACVKVYRGKDNIRTGLLKFLNWMHT